MQCIYCNYPDNIHHAACPEAPRANFAVASVFWQEGYSDGRARRAKKLEESTYQLGYMRGEHAAKEAENGFSPTHEGYQW